MKKLLFFGVSILIFFFGIYLISQGTDNKTSKFIKDNTPWQVKEFLKKTVFYVPLLKRENEKLEIRFEKLSEDNLVLQNKYDVLFNKVNLGKKIKKKIDNIYLSEVIPPIVDEKYEYQTKSGYLEFYDNYIIKVNGKGKIYFFDKNKLDDDFINFEIMDSNLYELINFKNNLRWTGIKDIKIINDNIYLSVTSEIENDCFSTSVINAKINFSKLNFKYLFKNQDCISSKKAIMAFRYFNGYQTGGRIENINEKIYLTIGDFNDWETPQLEDKFIGKIIEIDTINKSTKVVSRGHRNPQGLYVHSANEKLLISTEHGPLGGDEVNIIDLKLSLNENNYGWPLVSYGAHYDVVPVNSYTKKFAPLNKSHKELGFKGQFLFFKKQ